MSELITAINELAWGPPMLVLLLGTGLYLSLGLRFMTVRKIPVALVNGRISERSFIRYRYVRGWRFDPLGKVGRFCVQTERYADRFRQLGLPADQIYVTGSMKYDQLQLSQADGAEIRREIGRNQ